MKRRSLGNRFKIKLYPAQVIIAGFLSFIILGAILLTLPISTKPGHHIGFLDAAFTATSAVCVTGLVVVDTSTAFTLFGQTVILALIQLGGLGFMTITSFIFMLLGRRITLSERMIIRESLNEFHLSGLLRTIQKIFIISFATELTGAVILSTRFVPLFGTKGIFISLFHSVSSFCNAGFDLFGSYYGEYSSISAFSADAVVVITTMLLIIIGGLGFVVVSDVFNFKRMKKKTMITRYSQFVLIITGFLIAVGIAVFFPLELNNPDTLGSDNITAGQKILSGIFQAITPRTAGFSTINQAKLMPASKLFTMLLMFVGASPSGTGGGIKTTTFAILLLFALSSIKGKKDANLLGRRIAEDTLKRSVIITTLGIMFVIITSFALIIIEENSGELFTFENILFESFSAFGTVGLSAGITPLLQAGSKMVLMLSMFAGRVGLMTLTFALVNRANRSNPKIRYPEERFMVG